MAKGYWVVFSGAFQIRPPLLNTENQPKLRSWLLADVFFRVV